MAAALQQGDVALVGRTEAEVSAELGARLLAEGHHRVNFAIVAAGENAASPHHEPGPRVIRSGEVVLCDFGGTMLTEGGAGYCSDITRCVVTGEPGSEVADAYAALHHAQQAAVAAARVGTTCEAVDAVARGLLTEAGYGPRFIHRTGHGIGVEEHEDPYVVAGNAEPLVSGHAFSIEPGIYTPGRWGLRLVDPVGPRGVVGDQAPREGGEIRDSQASRLIARKASARSRSRFASWRAASPRLLSFSLASASSFSFSRAGASSSSGGIASSSSTCAWLAKTWSVPWVCAKRLVSDSEIFSLSRFGVSAARIGTWLASTPISPVTVLVDSWMTSPLKTSPSGVSTSTVNVCSPAKV